MNYTHIKTDNYQKIVYLKDGVKRAVLLPLNTPDKDLRDYFAKLKQAKTKAIPASELEAAVA